MASQVFTYTLQLNYEAAISHIVHYISRDNG